MRSFAGALALGLSIGLHGEVAAQAPPRLEPGACPFPGGEWVERERIDCGWLMVPEDRSRPDGPTLRLAVAIMRSTSALPEPDPVVFLSGGPGGASVRFMQARLSSVLVSAIRERRDYVVWDQRGTGYSDPPFCSELAAPFFAAAMNERPVDERRAALVDLAGACRAQMRSAGHDLAMYNSAVSAQDLDDLRQALGYRTWNLLGASYGTRLALTAARDTPDGIRSLILDAVTPPSVGPDRHLLEGYAPALRRVFDACAADARCLAEFPDLEGELRTALEELGRAPIELQLPDTARFPGGLLRVGPRAVALGLFQGMHSGQFTPLVPHAIRQIRLRNASLLSLLADELAPDPTLENPWLLHAVECHEQAPLATRDAILGEIQGRPWLELAYDPFDAICDALHDARADATVLDRPVASTIPSLVASGEMDPVTPPAFGALAASALSRSHHIVFPGMGHGTLPLTACGREITLRFLDEPLGAPDTTCVSSMLPFTVETDVRVAPGVARLAHRLTGGSTVLWLGWAAATLLGLLGVTLAWPVRTITRGRRAVAGEGAAGVAGWLTGVAAIGYVVGLALIARATLDRNPFLLGFGVPRAAAPLLWLPTLVAVLTLASAACSLRIWREPTTTRALRTVCATAVAAGASFTALAASLGLLVP